MIRKTVSARLEAKLLGAALIVTLGSAIGAGAHAADMKSDYGSRTIGTYPAVPVPAPIPVPETFSWYVRGDVGYDLKTQGNVILSGIPRVDLSAPSSHTGLFTGSFALGRYVTPSLRTELGIDIRNQQTVGRTRNGGYLFTTQTEGPLDAALNRTTDTNYFAADRQDTTTLASHTIMANAYYDFKNGSAFTPYLGAGVGVNIAQMKRSYTESAQCLESHNTDTSVGGIDESYVDPITGRRQCAASAQTFGTASGSKGITAYGPALALMAGTAVQLRPGVSLDAGYRLMWQGATPSISMGSVMGDISKIAIGARTDHELRMGVRWDIW